MPYTAELIAAGSPKRRSLLGTPLFHLSWPK